MPRYILLHKPWGMLSQFTADPAAPQGTTTLAALGLPPRVYPVGRLDRDSEGLLLLSDDAAWAATLTQPHKRQLKTYWVLVEHIPSPAALAALRSGVDIRVGRTMYRTQPAQAKILDPQPTIAPRTPPVRVRKNIRDAWLQIQISEGKNRQVRKMTAAVGHPTLRLIRQQIAHLHLGDLMPGQWREIDKNTAWGFIRHTW